MTRLRGRWPLTVTCAVIAVGSLFLLSQARYLWFFGDDWDFLLGRDLGAHPIGDLMRPHNEHWSAVPVLIYRAAYAVFGLHHFLAFALLPIVAHAATCLLLFGLLTWSGVRSWLALGVTAVMVFLGAGAENLLWSFQVGMISSAAFGLAALWFARSDVGRRHAAAAYACSVLSLAASGMGLLMLVWLGCFTLLRDGPRRTLVLTLPPLVVYAAWYLVWGRGSDTGIPEARVADIAPLAWKGLTATWGSMTGFAAAGPVIVLALLAAAIALRPSAEHRALALSGMAAAVVTFLVLAQSRGGLGPEATSSSRYLYFGALMTLPALAHALQWCCEVLARWRMAVPALVGLALAALITHGALGVVAFREDRDTLTPDLRGRTIAAATLTQSGERILDPVLDPDFNPQLQIDALAAAAEAGQVPNSPVPPRAELNARAQLQVGVAAGGFDLPQGRVQVSGTSADKSGGCLIGPGAEGGSVTMATGTGGQFDLALLGTGTAQFRLRQGRAISGTAAVAIPDGERVTVGVTAPDAELVVDLPAGVAYTVCGANTGSAE